MSDESKPTQDDKPVVESFQLDHTKVKAPYAVSYTHLTLPTSLSV